MRPAYLDEVADGLRDSEDGSLEVGHLMAGFALLVDDDKAGDLERNRVGLEKLSLCRHGNQSLIRRRGNIRS